MTYIKNYWKDSKKRAKQAKKHTEEMIDIFYEETQYSYKYRKLYSSALSSSSEIMSRKTSISIEAIDSVSAVFQETDIKSDTKVAVLNFASYKKPGGMFLEGSKAQEECLCHSSNLYNVLEKCSEYYEYNKKHLNKALYLNRALYTPKICFLTDNKKNYVMCDVITCAAPNYSAAKKFCNIKESENTKALTERIRFVFEIAKDQQVDTLILGAFGCGVFGQDPKTTAEIFHTLLENEYKDVFDKVVFAIPEGVNLDTFKKVWHS